MSELKANNTRLLDHVSSHLFESSSGSDTSKSDSGSDWTDSGEGEAVVGDSGHEEYVVAKITNVKFKPWWNGSERNPDPAIKYKVYWRGWRKHTWEKLKYLKDCEALEVFLSSDENKAKESDARTDQRRYTMNPFEFVVKWKRDESLRRKQRDRERAQKATQQRDPNAMREKLKRMGEYSCQVPHDRKSLAEERKRLLARKLKKIEKGDSKRPQKEKIELKSGQKHTSKHSMKPLQKSKLRVLRDFEDDEPLGVRRPQLLDGMEKKCQNSQELPEFQSANIFETLQRDSLAPETKKPELQNEAGPADIVQQSLPRKKQKAKKSFTVPNLVDISDDDITANKELKKMHVKRQNIKGDQLQFKKHVDNAGEDIAEEILSKRQKSSLDATATRIATSVDVTEMYERTGSKAFEPALTSEGASTMQAFRGNDSPNTSGGPTKNLMYLPCAASTSARDVMQRNASLLMPEPNKRKEITILLPSDEEEAALIIDEDYEQVSEISTVHPPCSAPESQNISVAVRTGSPDLATPSTKFDVASTSTNMEPVLLSQLVDTCTNTDISDESVSRELSEQLRTLGAGDRFKLITEVGLVLSNLTVEEKNILLRNFLPDCRLPFSDLNKKNIGDFSLQLETGATAAYEQAITDLLRQPLNEPGALNALLALAAKAGNGRAISLAMAEANARNIRLDVEQADANGFTLLHVVCAKQCTSDAHSFCGVCDTLLMLGCSVNAVSVSGVTPLMLAAASGDKMRVAKVLERGAFVDVVDERSRSALSWAIEQPSKEHAEIAFLLLTWGADFNRVWLYNSVKVSLFQFMDRFRSGSSMKNVLIEYARRTQAAFLEEVHKMNKSEVSLVRSVLPLHTVRIRDGQVQKDFTLKFSLHNVDAFEGEEGVLLYLAVAMYNAKTKLVVVDMNRPCPVSAILFNGAKMASFTSMGYYICMMSPLRDGENMLTLRFVSEAIAPIDNREMILFQPYVVRFHVSLRDSNA